MNHTKRICALLLALILVFAMTACGGGNQGDFVDNNPPTDNPDPAPANPVDPVDPAPVDPAPVDPKPAVPTDPMKMSDEEVLKTITYDTCMIGGMCGDDLYWCYKDGILVITGTGEMYDYGRKKQSEYSPWKEQQLEPRRVVIGEGATSIGSYAFYEITSLEMIGFPKSIESLGKCTLTGCTALKEATVYASKSFGTGTFGRCTALETVNLCGTATDVWDETFKDCTNLKSVTLPDSVTRIMSDAFNGCSALSKINFPENLSVIRNFAFAGCTSLTKVNLPQSTTELWMSAFTECTSLSEITMPGLVRMDEYVFHNCTALKEITLPATVTECYGLGNSGIEKVYIPASVTLETISGLKMGAEAYFAQNYPEITVVLQ